MNSLLSSHKKSDDDVSTVSSMVSMATNAPTDASSIIDGFIQNIKTPLKSNAGRANLHMMHAGGNTNSGAAAGTSNPSGPAAPTTGSVELSSASLQNLVNAMQSPKYDKIDYSGVSKCLNDMKESCHTILLDEARNVRQQLDMIHGLCNYPGKAMFLEYSSHRCMMSGNNVYHDVLKQLFASFVAARPAVLTEPAIPGGFELRMFERKNYYLDTRETTLLDQCIVDLDKKILVLPVYDPSKPEYQKGNFVTQGDWTHVTTLMAEYLRAFCDFQPTQGYQRIARCFNSLRD